MPALLLHLFAGMLAGAFFRVHTIIVLALLVLVEAASGWTGGTAVTLWFFLAEAVLQAGYLLGVYARSVLERLPQAVRFMGRASDPSA
jgi:hypothetical protein